MKTNNRGFKKISHDDILHVASLAILVLSSEEFDMFLPQLNSILDFISKLQQVDTSNVQPTSQVTGLLNVFREDKVDETRVFSQEKALSNAPATHNGFFKVPSVFDEN